MICGSTALYDDSNECTDSILVSWHHAYDVVPRMRAEGSNLQIAKVHDNYQSRMG